MTKALIILSGGLDSTVALALAAAGGKECRAITFWYGSRHNKAENLAAQAVCKFYDIPWEMIYLDFMQELKSALTVRGVEVPKGHYSAENMSQTVVPGRNAILLSVAAGWAVNTKCNEIWYGAHKGDHPIYPDCRESFATAMNEAFTIGYGVSLIRPFINSTKAQIVLLGNELQAPLGLTYSCYKGSPGEHCGECGTCVERAEAFSLANVPDPTRYKNPGYWREVCK